MAVLKKIKKAATSYVKNVVGGAKIVGSTISSAGKKAGSLGANVISAVIPNPTIPAGVQTGIAPVKKTSVPTGFNPILGGGNISNAQLGAGATGASGYSKSIGVLAPKYSSLGGSRSSGGSGSGNIDMSNISADSTALVNNRSFSSSSFSSPSGLTGLGTNASSIPTSNVVNTNVLGTQNQKLTFPEETIPDYSQYIPTPQEQRVEEAKDETGDALKDYLKSIEDAPSSADAYLKAQRETDILQKQQLVNDLTGQLNGIVNRGQAQQLAQVGQGRGIPEAIIGGIQAQIGRETAIAALPIQAQLSAAQGNLEMANDNLDTLFKIYSEDARNEYEYRKEVKKMVYEYASAAEKRELEKLDKLEERTYQEKQAILKDGKDYAKMAFENGQSTLGAQIMKLDINSPTYSRDLANLVNNIKDPMLALNIAAKNAEIAKTLKETSLLGEPSAAEKKQIAADLKSAKSSIPATQDKIIAVDVLLESPGLASRVGTGILSRSPQGFWGTLGKITTVVGIPELPMDIYRKMSGQGQEFAGGIHKLTSGLSLDSLIDAKSRGATFGALSDREMNILSSAATKLADWEEKDGNGIGKGYWNIDEGSFRGELKTIQELSRRALLLSQGTIMSEDEQSLIDTIFGSDYTVLDPANYY